MDKKELEFLNELKDFENSLIQEKLFKIGYKKLTYFKGKKYINNFKKNEVVYKIFSEKKEGFLYNFFENKTKKFLKKLKQKQQKQKSISKKEIIKNQIENDLKLLNLLF